ncbi:hypothetical protein [Geodermatophilus sp. CPCC 206100]|uniref:hypothetical protein n=1 Tax=Geodermatophilus sp. CPCC 206100 TaxID=3020054 RepID=UPI003AFF7E78
MLPRHSHSKNTAKLSVTVTDLSGVQRVLTMLTGRNYALTYFAADEATAGRWRTTLDVILGADQLDLLEARLHRVPSVLDVEMRSSPELAATA